MGKSIMAAMVVFGIIYLCAAFVALSINPHDWSFEMRATVAIFGPVSSAITVAIAALFHMKVDQ